jgi:hypothetical protein
VGQEDCPGEQVISVEKAFMSGRAGSERRLVIEKALKRLVHLVGGIKEELCRG